MKQIWKPTDSLFPLYEWATDRASEVCWEYPLEKMKAYTISLITRNMYQVYGDSETFEKTTPVDFVVYWCEGDPLKKRSRVRWYSICCEGSAQCRHSHI